MSEIIIQLISTFYSIGSTGHKTKIEISSEYIWLANELTHTRTYTRNKGETYFNKFKVCNQNAIISVSVNFQSL